MIQQLLKLDDYGRQIHTEDSAIDLIYHNPTVNLSNLEFDKDTIQSFNNACEMLYVEDRLKSAEELEITPDQYHKSNQQKWHMPDEYKNLDIAKGTSKVSRANPRYPIIIILTIVNNFLPNHENKKIQNSRIICFRIRKISRQERVFCKSLG